MLTNTATSISQSSFNSHVCVFRVVKRLNQGSSIHFREQSFSWTMSLQRTVGAIRARPDSHTWGDSSWLEITSLWASVSLLKYCCLLLSFMGPGYLLPWWLPAAHLQPLQATHGGPVITEIQSSVLPNMALPALSCTRFFFVVVVVEITHEIEIFLDCLQF